MKKILILVVDYDERDYIHPRNIEYQKNGFDVTVLDFARNEDCYVDNIKTICMNSYKKTADPYDILILHAANLRNHYFFLKKYGNKFERFIFFYHGHEVLVISRVYAKPYDYMKKNIIRVFLQDLYDHFKLLMWRNYLPKVTNKSDFVFVSNWMEEEFFKWTKIPREILEGKCHIIYNCIGEEFEKERYDDNSDKEFDFITIRSNIDGSKYCIDLVNGLAKSNDNLRFLVIGKGSYFEHDKRAENITHIAERLTKSEIIHYLNRARCALMPTRTDAQGVMMCEMASIGMPLITSDIPVCREVFDGFDNVRFIPLKVENNSLNRVLDELYMGCPYAKKDKYYRRNTCNKEVLVINKR